MKKILTSLKFAWFRLPASWRWSIIVCLLVRLFLGFLGVCLWVRDLTPTTSVIPVYNVPGEPIRAAWQAATIGVWLRWDANQYTSIARYGYSFTDLTAFFPAYPLLGRFISQLTNGIC